MRVLITAMCYALISLLAATAVKGEPLALGPIEPRVLETKHDRIVQLRDEQLKELNKVLVELQRRLAGALQEVATAKEAHNKAERKAKAVEFVNDNCETALGKSFKMEKLLQGRLDDAEKKLTISETIKIQIIASAANTDNKVVLLQEKLAISETLKIQNIALATSARGNAVLLQEKLTKFEETAAVQETWTDNETGMEFVLVEGGCFDMGSPDGTSGKFDIGGVKINDKRPKEEERNDDEGPVHEVCLDSFYLSSYEVTNRQFRMFDPNHNSGKYGSHTLDDEDQPVVEVGFYGAVKFAAWMKNRIGARKFRPKFRLPSEAEWEYAARAGTGTARYWGDDPDHDKACQYGNFSDKTSNSNWSDEFPHACNDTFAVAAPVHRKANNEPNKFGLHDMLGNVWEWVSDQYHGDYKGAPNDGTAWKDQEKDFVRVVRGGSWSNLPEFVRSAYRFGVRPGNNNGFLGFRIAFSQISPEKANTR